MTIQDITFLFKDQLENTDKHIFFIVSDNGTSEVIKHTKDKLDDLVLFLDNFIPDGKSFIPRFIK